MGRVVNKADYTFNKTAKTITFSSKYTGIELGQIQLITDVTNSTIIYQFNKVGFNGTLVGLVLTLVYDTTGAGFNNTDNLMIIINESQDNTQLYSGTLSTIGSISGVDTTDFQTISIQISGSWEGVVMVEGSNDNSFYIPLMVYPINELSLVDNINENGIYNLTTSTKFVRLNVQQLQSGSINTLIHGRIINGPNAADVLSMAMDRTQNMPLNVQETNLPKRDINNALVPSDAAVNLVINRSNYTNGEVLGQLDTTGYQTIVIHAISVQTFAVTVQISNDGFNWVNANGMAYITTTGVQTNINSSSTIITCPAIARYIRFVAGGTGGSCNLNIYLRQTPYVGSGFSGNQTAVVNTVGTSTNINAINGSTPTQPIAGTSTGAQSSLSGWVVGQASAYSPGGTSVPYPIVIGGRQAPATGYLSGILRTMLMDTSGRVMLGTSDQTKSTVVDAPLQTISSNYQNGNSLSVTDLSQTEGQTRDELLTQMLLEMKIMNRYLSELPLKLNAGLNNLDEPEAFRQDQTFFNI